MKSTIVQADDPRYMTIDLNMI